MIVDIAANAAADTAGNASAAAPQFSIEASLATDATRIVLSTGSATVDEDAGTFTVTMSLENPPSSGQYRQCGLRAVSAGTTATATDDYTLPNNTRWLQPSNSYSVDISVTVVDDTEVDGDETLVLEGFCNKTHGNPGTTHDQLAATPLTVTLADNDTPTPTLVLSTNSATPAEDAGTVTVTLTLNHPPDSGHYRQCGLRAVATGTTATATDDYTLPANTRWLRSANSWTVDIDVTLVDDTDIGDDKTLVLEGFCGESYGEPDPTHDQLSATPLTLTITENDVAPTTIVLSTAAVTVSEDVGTVRVAMSLENPPSSGQYRDCGLRAVPDGTTADATDDYTLPNNRRWLQPSNSYSVNINVAVVDDTDVEDDETLVLEGFCDTTHGNAEPTHDQLAATPLTLTIEDDENAAPTFDESPPVTRSVAENTATDTTIGIAVSATDPENDTLTYSLDGTDKTSFAIDTSTGQLKTSAALDHEADASYEVTVGVSDQKDLSGNADTAVDATVDVTITITDEDEPPAAPAAPTVTPAATNGHNTLDVSWTGPPTDDIPAITDYTVEYRKKTDDDSETWADHPFTGDGTSTSIGSLDPSTTYQVQVAATNDEGTSGFSPPGEGTTDAATLTADYAAAAYSVTEGGTAVTIKVTLAPAADRTVSVPIAVTAGTAESGDYTVAGLTNNALSFAVSETSKTFTITANQDADNEDETVTLGFGTVTNSDLTAGQTSTLTVRDNEPQFTEGATALRSVAENTADDVAIGSAVSATDVDNDTLLYSLDGSDKDAFAIDTGTGQLKTKAALDHEDDAEYSVTVGVSDQKDVDGNTDTAVDATVAVTIAVTDEDEPPPVPAAPTVSAAAVNGHITLEVSWTAPATDGIPAIIDYTVEYRSKTDDDSETWSDHPFTGDGTSTSIGGLDPDTTYQVQVAATNDEGTGDFSEPGEGATDAATLTVDYGAAAYSVTEGGTEVTIEVTLTPAANRTVPVPIAVTAGTAESGDYTVSGLTNNALSFAASDTSKTFTITANEDADNEDETVALGFGTITDSDLTIGQTSTLTIRDNEPQFTEGTTAQRSVAENTADDATIGSAVSATDANSGDTLLYSLDGTDKASFALDTGTGQLKTKAALDHEDDAEYSVTVGVSDQKDIDGNADTAVDATIAVAITVTDVDEPPAAPAPPSVSAAATNGHSTLDVSWTAPATDGIPGVTDYTVEYRKKTPDDSETWASHPVTGTGTTTSIASLDPSTTYQVQVAATNDEGTGDFSEPGEGTTDAVSMIVDYASTAYTVTEGGTEVMIEVTLTPASNRTVTVPIAVTAGTAESGDYTVSGLTNNALSFAASETSKTFTITANEDADNEDETVALGFGPIIDSDLTAGQTSALTIRDNEPLVTLALTPSSISENGGNSTVTASLPHGALSAFTVTVSESSTAVELSANTALRFIQNQRGEHRHGDGIGGRQQRLHGLPLCVGIRHAEQRRAGHGARKRDADGDRTTKARRAAPSRRGTSANCPRRSMEAAPAPASRAPTAVAATVASREPGTR